MNNMASFAFVLLLNCRFPFDATIAEKLNQLPTITNVYRTSGVTNDLILKVTAETEDALHKVLGN
jgi:DNA-binding Lrp family transcriptional regulator